MTLSNIPLVPKVTLLRHRPTGITIRFVVTFKVKEQYYWQGFITDAGETGYLVGNPYSGKKEEWEEVTDG